MESQQIQQLLQSFRRQIQNMEEIWNNSSDNGPMSEPMNLSADVAKKEWQNSLPADHRDRLIHNLLIAMFPTANNSFSAFNRRLRETYYRRAQRIEGDIFKMAHSKSEYDNMMAEEIDRKQKQTEREGPDRQATRDYRNSLLAAFNRVAHPFADLEMEFEAQTQSNQEQQQ